MKTIKLFLTGIKLRIEGFFLRKQKPAPTLEIKGLSELIKQTEKLAYYLDKANESMINFKKASNFDIDYRSLLKKYMAVIDTMENSFYFQYIDQVEINEKEITILKEIAAEIESETNN